MKKIIQLVDSSEYVLGNCFQHQLLRSLKKSCHIIQVELKTILSSAQSNNVLKYDSEIGVISCLKQRTLHKHMQTISTWLNNQPVVIYDQDPWHAYMDDSEYKGTYENLVGSLNVKCFALTTKWWVDFLNSKNIPAIFVKMWVLPEYCVNRSRYVERKNIAGFVGSIHPYRQKLLDVINDAGIQTSVLKTNSLNYASYLEKISDLRCFVHNEDLPFTVDGVERNLNVGLWIKDIEAMSQGCFSIRNIGNGSDSYFENLPEVDGKKMITLCHDIKEFPAAIHEIENMNVEKRQLLIDQTVKFIKEADYWRETAESLILNS